MLSCADTEESICKQAGRHVAGDGREGRAAQVSPLQGGRRKRPGFRVGYARAVDDGEAEAATLLRTGSTTGATL